jgi:Ser/Thr protein kinase RdoA (MazF antagonist)
MAIAQYEEIPVHELPQAFVHADLTKGNVITDASGRVYILDFSVSNWYPRIQELAVIAANLLHSDSSPASMTERCQKVAAGYQVFTRLTDVELCSLHAYSLAVVTSEFLGASLEIHLNGNTSTETESWLRLGRNNLRMEFGPQSRHRGLQS